MDIEEWWPRLHPTTQQLLIDNNGDAVPPKALEEIVAAGGFHSTWGSRNPETGSDGYLLSDTDTDWIEATANDERPDRR